MIYGLLIFVVPIKFFFFSFFFLFQFLNIILICQKIDIKKMFLLFKEIKNIYNNIVYYYIYYSRNRI